jgi:hypothetical protein
LDQIDKILFLVLGVESSGSHVTSTIMQRMGCFWEEPQRLNKFLSGGARLSEITSNPHICLRRSVPHGHTYPDLIHIRKRFATASYRMKTIVLVRDWPATVLSSCFMRRDSTSAAMSYLRSGWRYIGKHLVDVEPYYFFNTSLLFKHTMAAIRGLESFTGLKWQGSPDFIYDADASRHKLLLEHDLLKITKEMIPSNEK